MTREYARLPARGSTYEPLSFLANEPKGPCIPVAEVIPQLVVIQNHDVGYLSRDTVVEMGQLSVRPAGQEDSTAS